jgi:hypothetical protein
MRLGGGIPAGGTRSRRAEMAHPGHPDGTRDVRVIPERGAL